MRDLACQEPAEYQAETHEDTVEDNMENNPTKAAALFPLFGIAAITNDQFVDRRRCRERIAADDDHRHLHRERDEVPETGSEPLSSLNGRTADADASQKHDDHGHKRQRKRVRKPALQTTPKAASRPPQAMTLLVCLQFSSAAIVSTFSSQPRSGGRV
jgi:hypothetical protein